MKKAIVLGGGGFIGNHLVSRLRAEGYHVRAVDLKRPDFGDSEAHEFIIGDLRDPKVVDLVIEERVDEIYQLAADMGGAGYIFTGDNDAAVMHNSATINLNVAEEAKKKKAGVLFYSSSACMYPEYNQLDPNNPKCCESSAYPAAPDSEYGWEKLFSERLFLAYSRNYNLNIRIARFHNIYGPKGTWRGGKEKAPAAIARKVAEVQENGFIEIWGDGLQTRSFLYIDDCVDAVRALVKSDFQGPVNIGSEEMISINSFAKLVIEISNKQVQINNISGPQGVRGRNSDNVLMKQMVGWAPRFSLREGMVETYNWVAEQVRVSN